MFQCCADNNIGDDGACALSEALKTNTRVFHIGLMSMSPSKVFLVKCESHDLVHVHEANKVGDKGAIALGEMMKTNTGLKILHLRGILPMH